MATNASYLPKSTLTFPVSPSAIETISASLPPEVVQSFTDLVRYYKSEQYEEAIQAANAILENGPNHAEILSMKGLILNCMGNESDAFTLVQHGLQSNINSSFCWHVVGFLHRSNRQYKKAKKCYESALKINPENIQILLDLSSLQAQMEDLDGFIKTMQVLTLISNDHTNWIGLAVAYHFKSSTSKAIEILEHFERTVEDGYHLQDEEHREILLYKVSLLEECGLFQKALEELSKNGLKSADNVAYEEQRGSLLIKIGHLKEGEELYRGLLSLNPENYRYYEGLQRCLNLYSEKGYYFLGERNKLETLYEELGQQYEQSLAVKRIPLDFLHGNKFREAAERYIRPLLAKGVPWLFSDLSLLYDQPKKANILEQIILEIEISLSNDGQFPRSMEKEPPSTLTWTLFFLAQHYDRCGQYENALSKIDEAIRKTPSVIDMYLVKSQILKHDGDLASAANKARCMNLDDPNVNGECMQADQVAPGEKNVVLLTKDGDRKLNDMMLCMRHELAAAEIYFLRGDIRQALNKFLHVDKHCAHIARDQFDFYSYGVKRMTLRTYMEMFKFRDQLHSHAYFQNAAAGAIRCYMKIHGSGPNSHCLSPSRRRRSGNRKERMAVKDKVAEEKSDGEQLVQVVDRLMKLLLKYSPNSLETHVLSFEFYMRKEKVLIALKALKQLLRLDDKHLDSQHCLNQFLEKARTMDPEYRVTDYDDQIIWETLKAECQTISQLRGESLFVQRKGELAPNTGWKLKDCIEVHKILGTVLVDPDAALRWKVRCAEIFPYSTYFEGSLSSACPNSALSKIICNRTEDGSSNKMCD